MERNLHILGMDIGGTKIEVSLLMVSEIKTRESILFSLSGSAPHYLNTLDKKRMPTAREKGYSDVLERIISLVNDLLLENDLEIGDIQSLGIGLPGSVDPTTQQMLKGNTNIFVGEDFKADLQKGLKGNLDIQIENDANCFALAEALCGVGLKYREQENISFNDETSVGIILGTGVGGGILLGGKLLKGKKGGGAEIGHTQLLHNGFDCYCGRKGCVEQYLSGPGFSQYFAFKSPSMAEDPPGSGDIFTMAEDKNPLALKMIDEYQDLLVQFLANLNNILDPDYFVLGGGVSSQDIIYKGLEEKLHTQTFLKESRPKVFKHHLGDSAGVIGAALLPFLEKELLQ